MDELSDLITSRFPGVSLVVASEEGGAPEVAWGDRFFFFDPDGDEPASARMPFATIVTNDYDGFDEASNLKREGVFRLNLWVSRDTMRARFGDLDAADHDYTVLDRVIPHPVYAKQSWLCVLNPGPTTDEDVRALVAEAHAGAVERHRRRRQAKGDT
jgi:hypothetical protein